MFVVYFFAKVVVMVYNAIYRRLDMIHVVMVEPEIPQNAGNVVRLTAAAGVKLHLVKPLGFVMEDKYLKRAGLDYWDMADITIHESLDEFLLEHKGANMYFASTKSAYRYDEVDYSGVEDIYILFGKETKGLPEWLLNDNYDHTIRIPMIQGCRSLNLSNSISIILYEAMRQRGFERLESQGHLTEY